MADVPELRLHAGERGLGIEAGGGVVKVSSVYLGLVCLCLSLFGVFHLGSVTSFTGFVGCTILSLKLIGDGYKQTGVW